MSLEDKLYPLLKVYDSVPDGMKTFLGAVYRILPEKWKWGEGYSQFKRLIRESLDWDEEDIREYQLKQIRSTLMRAQSSCPWYRKAFARAKFHPEKVLDPEDIVSAPLLEKSDIQEHLQEFVSLEYPASKRLYITTGGSTGVPVGFYLQKGVSRPKEQAFLEAMWHRAGWQPGARLVLIRGHVTTQSSSGRIYSYDATRNWLLMSSAHLTAERMPEYLERIETFKPDFLHVYPSAALQIAEYLDQSRQSWRVPLKALLCGSERLNLPQKRMLERVFRCQVYRWYGHSERAVLAGEGASTPLFYFWPTYGYTELGPADEEGYQEVIATSFHNHVMPLIRYRTGDYVKAATADYPHELPWLAATEIAGREQEFLISATGRRISLTMFNMHDAVFDHLYAVQFYQKEPGVAEFRYKPTSHFSDSQLETIRSGVKKKLGDDFKVSFRAVEETDRTARGKHRWLVSELPSPNVSGDEERDGKIEK
ncbi:MAG: phenylacetate--CoA ligase family protein [Verrucomicrobiae bacterium]|nr:phenylacetate--CoA ligase family protein [Verrucomicrobiae bacterium]